MASPVLLHSLVPYAFFAVAVPLSAVTSFIPDLEALLRVKKSLNNPQPLDSRKAGTHPCDRGTRWAGLSCNENGIVTNINLHSMNLTGPIDVGSLSQMRSLRSLDLAKNSFSGTIPEFNRIGTLKALYLMENSFSGKIPPDYFLKMESLKKVWLAENNFTGLIPTSLAQLPHLMELHLEHNSFSGPIPCLEQQTLESLSLSLTIT